MRLRFPLAFLLPLLCLAALRADLSVCLLPSDVLSPAAVAAVGNLRRDPEFSGIAFHVIPELGQDAADRARLRDADLAIVYIRGKERALKLAPEVAALRARGATVFAVGPTFDADLAAAGFAFDQPLTDYFTAGGRENLAQMLRAALARKLRPGLAFAPPVSIPESGFFDLRTMRVWTSHADYLAAYLRNRPERRGRPWVGIHLPRTYIESATTRVVEAAAEAFEARGLNVLVAYGPSQDTSLRQLFLETDGRPRIDALASLSLKMGFVPEKIIPALDEIGAPVVNGISLGAQSRAEWEASPTGIAVLERSWQVGGPELVGSIAPTVVAAKERVADDVAGSAYVIQVPIDERIDRFADRVARWVRLRHAAPAERRVAVLYYNYPPGRENVGASYLNVLPGSLWQILQRLRADGYTPAGAPESPDALFTAVRDFGSNARANDAADLDRLVRCGHAVLWPVAAYRKYFDALPAALRDSIVKKWGEPEAAHTMVWHDKEGRPFFVFPVHRWGNVLYAPQPTRGWEEDVTASYHDLKLPLHHQYLAFYLWLQHEFNADAMVHVGRHATHEWQSGKEVGFTSTDPGEVLVGAVPQLYLYIVDGIGEGLQAKRRGMATIIDHLTPPLDRASLNPEMRELMGRIGDFRVAREKGSVVSDDTRREIAQRAAKAGVFTDLGLALEPGQLLDNHQIEEIEDHLTKIGEKLTPFGMHTFGVAPDEKARRATADAILSLEPDLAPDVRAKRHAELMRKIADSGPAELDALSAGLAGRYIPAGPGNDPVRAPDSLPTGRNFYGFDPTRLPTPASYAAGAKLAATTVENYRAKHGAYPERLVYTLWSTETNRHEGVMESQIFALLGVRPVWNARGRVDGVELISREELGRPRIDVTVTPSGLYRDAFPSLMHLIDRAVDLAKKSAEADNAIARHIAETRTALLERGVDPALAERLASVRLFSSPPGAYGVGLERVITADKTWDKEKQVADVYFNRVGHLFGQGFWGDAPQEGPQGPVLAQDVFKLALKGAQGVVHSRSSNVYGAIDIDDVYQHLGGAAMAVRQVNGKTPEALISDLSDPRAAETVTLERYMGRELRARYLNPKWIKAMLDEGYAGSRFLMRMTDNLWGWQVTVPEAVDGAKWQELFEVYVQDRYKLDIRKKFEAAGNLRAYEALVDRMLVAVDKGYWQADDAVVKEMREVAEKAAQQIAAEEAKEAAARESIPLPDTALLLDAAPSALPAPSPAPAPAAPPPPAPAQPATPPPAAAQPPPPAAQPPAQPAPVQGKVLEEVSPKTKQASTSALTPGRIALGALAGLAAVLALVAFGWWRQGKRSAS
jgi:cobaltochelatase CobN